MKISDLVNLLVERLARDGDQDIKSLRLEDTVGKNNVPKLDMIFEYKEKEPQKGWTIYKDPFLE